MTVDTRVVVVPSAPVLLSCNAGLTDPVGPLRAAVRDAVAWLVAGARDDVVVLCPALTAQDAARGVRSPAARVLAEELLGAADAVAADVHEVSADAGGSPGCLSGRSILALADGSARRSERAPGYVDPRAVDYDDEVGRALRSGDVAALRRLDVPLGTELLAGGAAVLAAMARSIDTDTVPLARTSYDDDPFGVQYWVVSWGPSA